MKSSFLGIHTYSGKRGLVFPNIFDWLEVKRRDDNVGRYWRVHDKLYDLGQFADKHPGGKDWIEFSRGIDITEAFEASHVINTTKVEQLLSKYFVKDAESLRNSPYTFEDDGFYRTVKRKIEPILKEIGMEPSPNALLIQDSLAAAYIILALVSVHLGSSILQVIAGLVLGMCLVAAHNFFHKRDNWRRFYMDLSPLSSYEWRISHAFSHHLYPNTILDFEVLLSEPFFKMLPNESKNFVQKYVAMIYVEPLSAVYALIQIVLRIVTILQGKQKFRKEYLIIYIELGIFLMIAPTYWDGFSAWITIFMAASFWFIFVSNNSAHHHPDLFHDGDQARSKPDFGLCQLDATRGKSDWYHQPLFSVMTTFGEHPLHHLFPTVCHSKLHFIKQPILETLKEFSEDFPDFTQLQFFIGTHKQLSRTKPNSIALKCK